MFLFVVSPPLTRLAALLVALFDAHRPRDAPEASASRP